MPNNSLLVKHLKFPPFRNKTVKYCTTVHVPYRSLNRLHLWRWQWNDFLKHL